MKDKANQTSREVLPKIVGELLGWTSPSRESYVPTETLELVLSALVRAEGCIPTRVLPKIAIPEAWASPESSKVLMVPVYDDQQKPAFVVLTQPMLKEVLRLVGGDDLPSTTEDHLDLVCFNLLEQYGVEPDMKSEHEGELLALTLHRELAFYASVYTAVSPAMLVTVAIVCATVPSLIQGLHAAPPLDVTNEAKRAPPRAAVAAATVSEPVP